MSALHWETIVEYMNKLPNLGHGAELQVRGIIIRKDHCAILRDRRKRS